jgi:hypothetical protein
MIKRLGRVLAHNYPGVEGIDTLDGVIVRWPDDIGTQPDADALQTMSDAFNALRDWDDLRTERNTKLTESDWTQYNDSPLTDEVKTSWQTYRESLRDLPENTDDPADPTWPTPPG